MLWAKQHRILFIHNPKCAGTAVYNAMLSSYPNAKKYCGRFYSSDLDRIIDLSHLTIHEAYQIIGIKPPVKSFGFIRNPYNRFVSAYWHIKGYNRSFEYLSIEDLAFDMLNEENIRYDWKFIHFIPQYRMFFYKDKQVVLKLWKIESLSTTWSDICIEYGIKSKLEYENVRINCPNIVLSDRLKSRINFLYARDFNLLGYEPWQIDNYNSNNINHLYVDYVSMWPEWRNNNISDYYKR